MKEQFKLDSLGMCIVSRCVFGIAVSAGAIHRYTFEACVLLVLAVWFDVIICFIASKKQWSKTNVHVELESFADFSCFCLTPWLLTITVCDSIVSTLCASVFLVAGVFRIARFNIEGVDANGCYSGLPVTYNGYLFPVAFLVCSYLEEANQIIVLSLVCILVAGLMVFNKLKVPEC